MNMVIIFWFCKILLAFNLTFPDMRKTFPQANMIDSNLVNYTFVSRLETFFPLHLIPPETEKTLTFPAALSGKLGRPHLNRCKKSHSILGSQKQGSPKSIAQKHMTSPWYLVWFSLAVRLLMKHSSTSQFKGATMINQPDSVYKQVASLTLIWLYLIKTRIILDRDVSMDIQF